MSRWTIVVLAALAAVCISEANAAEPPNAPPGLGQAGVWVQPCMALDRQVRIGKLLDGEDGRQAALCEGAFSAIMAVNYISPPYLPFCVSDNTPLIAYVRTFLSFMAGNPDYVQKQFGLAVLVSLARAYPKEACSK